MIESQMNALQDARCDEDLDNNLYFKDAKEMVCWLMDNERSILADNYGRNWFYADCKFYFKPLGSNRFINSIQCLHLFGTEIREILL